MSRIIQQMAMDRFFLRIAFVAAVGGIIGVMK
jgi:hypothetical protein